MDRPRSPANSAIPAKSLFDQYRGAPYWNPRPFRPYRPPIGRRRRGSFPLRRCNHHTPDSVSIDLCLPATSDGSQTPQRTIPRGLSPLRHISCRRVSDISEMKRAAPWENDAEDVTSDDSSSSDSGLEDDGRGIVTQKSSGNIAQRAKEDALNGELLQRAEIYQGYMKHIPVPTQHSSVIPFSSWQGLAQSMKKLYGQPLHYQTNVLLKQWDQLRTGSMDELLPLDFIIHPAKAESIIWISEEVHRLSTSHHHLAKLWASDPMYHAFIDPIIFEN